MSKKSTEQEISDRYTLDGLIGEGGMALVYQANDENLDRGVAIKILRPELKTDSQFTDRFREEARIMAQLDHPGSIPVHETGESDDGQLFLSMKRVHGNTLEELLNKRRADDIRDHRALLGYVDIFERVCQTVAAAHRQGIIHRDLKPDNIMIDELGEVYVMDWGIAKQLGVEEHADDGRTKMGAVMGTPAYMSPELAMGKASESDRQSDVFTLGAILYEILTGIQPFKKNSALESMKGVIYHDPDEPRKKNRRASRILSAICMKALNKDPYRRYRDAGELAQDIRAYREFRPVSAIKYGPVYRLWGWHQRRPVLTSILGTLGLMFVIAIVGIGTSTSIDNVLVNMTYEEIDELQNDIVALQLKLDDYDTRLANQSLLLNQRVSLQRVRDGTERRMAFKRRMIANLAHNIAGMTLLSRDARAEDVMFESVMANVHRELSMQHYDVAREMLGYILTKAGTPRDPFNLSERQIVEVQRMYKEVEAQLDIEP